jgi:hypothetical protein
MLAGAGGSGGTSSGGDTGIDNTSRIMPDGFNTSFHNRIDFTSYTTCSLESYLHEKDCLHLMPLHYAVMAQAPLAVRDCLRKGANVNCKDIFG